MFFRDAGIQPIRIQKSKWKSFQEAGCVKVKKTGSMRKMISEKLKA